MHGREFVFPENVEVVRLAQALAAGERIAVGQWLITVDEHGAWLTNPYGVDCALFPADEAESAEKICAFMKAGDMVPHEWGRL